jgi:hypothetical protein
MSGIVNGILMGRTISQACDILWNGSLRWQERIKRTFSVGLFKYTLLTFFSSTVVPTRILIFSQFSTRDSAALLHSLAESLQANDIYMPYVIFTTYNERRDRQARIGTF